ncbi:MAG: hypothetical protein Q9219_004452 [cf. Caloplaca sp. 3 TL-2023]
MDTSSSKPTLPQLDIPQTDMSIAFPSFSPDAATTTPRPHAARTDAASIATVRASPVTAICTRVHSTAQSDAEMPPLERQGRPSPRVRGTRLSDYDSHEEEEDEYAFCTRASSVKSWVARPPRSAEVERWPAEWRVGKEEKEDKKLGHLLLEDFAKAWYWNQHGLPRRSEDTWAELLTETLGRRGEKVAVWVKDDERSATAGRMGIVRRTVTAGNGSRSRLRFSVGVEEEEEEEERSLKETKSGKRVYRSSRFNEMDVDSRTGRVCPCPCLGGKEKNSTVMSRLELSAEQERVYLRRAKEELLMPAVESTIVEEVVRRVAEGMERCSGCKGDIWRKLRAECAALNREQAMEENRGEERRTKGFRKLREKVRGWRM